MPIDPPYWQEDQRHKGEWRAYSVEDRLGARHRLWINSGSHRPSPFNSPQQPTMLAGFSGSTYLASECCQLPQVLQRASRHADVPGRRHHERKQVDEGRKPVDAERLQSRFLFGDPSSVLPWRGGVLPEPILALELDPLDGRDLLRRQPVTHAPHRRVVAGEQNRGTARPGSPSVSEPEAMRHEGRQRDPRDRNFAARADTAPIVGNDLHGASPRRRVEIRREHSELPRSCERSGSADDRAKLAEYKALPSLDYILFVNTEHPSVQFFWRGTDGLWKDVLVDGLDARIDLEKLNISFSLRDIYDEIKFRPKPKLVIPEDDEPTGSFSPT